ncbi:hypothetical protein BU25DRAFT_458411 [Macroventuria anomochaeta]|uniref:Uncharacterized protein n=1 Tax=Macroventuria anomochaeta TaxID=301207 RepID=A0ACB6S2A1_9PLEO|nr:uncharacterized protein BU25DRAFT_458411 [Macroventuria anomochaeta]KAF2627509.1 hypothetical protein BU25DRAFT_458411 [Macroventuria anomochaeta]
MFWQGPYEETPPWKNWPGAHLPKRAHPPGTTYSQRGVPQYPLGTTCKDLGERDPYFPLDWRLLLLTLVTFLLYIVWPLYVLRHLMRKKSIYGDQEIYEANHDKFKYGEKPAQHDGKESAEE